jgi:hypothetical protein
MVSARGGYTPSTDSLFHRRAVWPIVAGASEAAGPAKARTAKRFVGTRSRLLLGGAGREIRLVLILMLVVGTGQLKAW